MIDPSQIRFPSIDKAFLRGIFWLLIFIYLAESFSIFRGIYDHFLGRPEVRYEITSQSTDIVAGGEYWLQRTVRVNNGGNGDAKNVRVQIAIPGSQITRLKIMSEEAYSTPEEQELLDDGASTLALDRLAAGAQVVITVWAVISSHIDHPEIAISATFDGGSAESSQRPTALEEIHLLADTFARGLRTLWLRLSARFAFPSLYRDASSRFPLADTEFREAFLATAILLVGAWLLLPRHLAAVLFAFAGGGFAFLFLDFWVSSTTLVIATILAIVALLFTRSNRERLVLVGGTILTWFWVIDRQCLATLLPNNLSLGLAIPACVPLEVPGGIWLGYGLMVLYLGFIEL